MVLPNSCVGKPRTCCNTNIQAVYLVIFTITTKEFSSKYKCGEVCKMLAKIYISNKQNVDYFF